MLLKLGWCCAATTLKTLAKIKLIDKACLFRNLLYGQIGVSRHDYYSGTTYEGGQSVDVPSKLSEIPLFVKAGSILLTQQPTMFAQEDAKALELRVFARADGTCVYYQDDGISYAYETGAYAEIRFFWNDEAQQLTIREVKKLRNAPLPMIIHRNHSETMIRYDGGEKCISFY